MWVIAILVPFISIINLLWATQVNFANYTDIKIEQLIATACVLYENSFPFQIDKKEEDIVSYTYLLARKS